MSIDEKELDRAIRAVMALTRVKGKTPQPTKRDFERRFRLEIVRGKPRMAGVK